MPEDEVLDGQEEKAKKVPPADGENDGEDMGMSEADAKKMPGKKKKMPGKNMAGKKMPPGMMAGKELADDLKTKEYVPMGVMTWADWDAYEAAEDAAEAIQETTSIFMQLVWNTLCCPDVANKQKALVALVNDYAKRLDPSATEDKEVSDSEPFMLVKEQGGRYRWFAIYSNNFRDDDYPAEIISTKSHRTFTDMAMKGEVDMPELWQWHIPGSRYGQADSLYFGDDGFALATGLIDQGKEHIAEAMLANKEQHVLVSHGMPIKYLIRNPQDPTVIDFHITKEISTLPGYRAANKLTGFSLLTKELDMQLDEKRRNWLKSNNYSEAEIQQIEAALATKALEGENRESKETSAPDTQAAPVTQATPATPVTPVAQAEPAAEAKTEPAAEKAASDSQPFNVKELVDAVTAVVKPVVERVATLEKAVSTLAQAHAQTEDALAQKAKAAIEETPQWSLKELMAMNVFGPESLVKANSPLAKDAPKEKEATIPADALNFTGIAFVDELIRNSRATPLAQ